MHDLLDTEDWDAESERYWPDGYKLVIRQDLPARVKQLLEADRAFEQIYMEHYGNRFSEYEKFTERIAEMVAIGSENGTDDMFEELHAAYIAEVPLPLKRVYAHLLLPECFDDALKEAIVQAVVEEYAVDPAYANAYEHYQEVYRTIPEFVAQVGERVVAGAVKGAEDMLHAVYSCLFLGVPLPPARRRPKRLRRW